MNYSEESLHARTDSFVHVLISDATISLRELGDNDTPFRRRSAIRTVFSSIEGLMYVTRDLIKVFPLSHAEATVISEVSFEVTERGTISERKKFIPFDRVLKVIAKIIRKHRPEYKLDFNHPGWASLLRLLDVRHRLTHPKEIGDLSVSDQEIEDANRGFYWFLAFALEVGRETVESVKVQYANSPYRNEGLEQYLQELDELMYGKKKPNSN